VQVGADGNPILGDKVKNIGWEAYYCQVFVVFFTPSIQMLGTHLGVDFGSLLSPPLNKL
jgi:hypothetical protein